MKIEFAQYSHSKVGFPHVKLKWTFDGREYHSPYIVIKGLIQNWSWSNTRHIIVSENDLIKEIERFEKYVIDRFKNDATVQG